MSESATSPSGKLKLKLVLAVVVVTGLLVASRLFPIGEYLKQFLDWIRELGPLGYGLFVLAYVAASVFFLPGSVLTLGAGAVFGLAGGFAAVSIGSTLGGAASFLVGRFLARDAIAKRVQGNARFAAIDQAVGREGFKIVLLTRLSPVFPFNLLNYAYGLTKVPFWQFVFASWLGMMPGTLLYVYLGTAAGDLAGAGTGSASSGGWGLAVKLLGLAATIAVTVVITRVARKALAAATLEAGATP
ncbi:TVP38/TMEM64 family protein [Candidatus Poribacteria bacterium]|nr:TVP38/TMEM64 family protein [Candidatus Poribacteria bacterium]